MLLGLGVDLCAIERVGEAIGRPRFLERVFSPAERERLLAASGPRRDELAAGLFAAKEAVAKALGTGFTGFGPWDIEVAPDAAGRPRCRLMNGALARAEALAGDGWSVFVSITHEGGMAAAVAVLEGSAERPRESSSGTENGGNCE